MLSELDEIIRRCQVLGCGMIVVVPPSTCPWRPRRQQSQDDAVAVLRQMVERVAPHGIRLSLEFCGRRA